MKFKYRGNKPIVPVRISNEERWVGLVGILDSGADYCTAPRAICEELTLKQIREQEIYIPGGTLMLPVFKGIMTVNGLTKKLEIVGVDLHPKLNIDCLVGRNLFGEIDVHLLGKSGDLILDLEGDNR
jgi:predicted aspartyl protease